MGSLCNKLPDEYTKEIEEAVGQWIGTLPLAYINERKRIIEKMRETAPGSYENLFYADYPDKNRSQVNILACKNITSDEAKKQIANQINEQIKPKIDAKTADMNPIAAEALKKTVEKTIEQFVDKAIDSFVKNLDKIDTKEKVEN